MGAGYVTAASIVSNSLRTTTRRGPELEDAEIWWAKYPMATIWVGQGKVPFGRQEFTSSGKQQFVDRWIGNALYAPGRDQGIRIEGMNASKTFEYALGAYNGIARNININDNDSYLYSGRVGWMPFGEYKFEESSLDYPDRPKLVLALAGLDNTVGTGAAAIDVSRAGLRSRLQVGRPQRPGRVLRRERREPEQRQVGQPGLLRPGRLPLPGQEVRDRRPLREASSATRPSASPTSAAPSRTSRAPASA